MKKSLLALAVLGAFAGAASAQSSVTLYGKVDLAFSKATGTKDKQIADNNASRIGLKGSEDLGNGLSAFFKLESQLEADTGAAKTPFWNRWSSVGLAHSKYGSLQLGHMENGAWDTVTAYDPWGGDTVAQLRDVGATLLDLTTYSSSKNSFTTVDVRRLDNSVRYDLSLNGFKVAASYAEKTTGKDNPFAIGGNYTMGPLNVGLAYEKSAKASDDRLVMGGASYDFGVAKLMASYSDGRNVDNDKVKGFIVGATAPYGAFKFKVGYAQAKTELADGSASGTYKKASVGGEYNLSKRTKLYADYAHVSGDLPAAQDNEKNAYDFGLSHAF